MKCCRCGVELTLENAYLSALARYDYRCKDCMKKSAKRHYDKNKNDPEFKQKRRTAFKKWLGSNREHFNELQRDYHRAHYLRVDGVLVQTKKRQYPPMCELCGYGGRLNYHHWDNKDPSKGLWICNVCHWRAEMVDNPFNWQYLEKYLKLKAQIDRLGK